jgi:hypothetical protein
MPPNFLGVLKKVKLKLNQDLWRGEKDIEGRPCGIKRAAHL